MPDLVGLSKFLSLILRHKAAEEGFAITTDGYIKVDDILKHKYCVNKYSKEDIVNVVESSEKQRFAFQTDPDGNLWIRANQGHSMTSIKVDMKRIDLANSSEYPEVIHGTYHKFIASIKKQGLSRCKRQHIHCSQGKSAISGARKDCDTFIYIDLVKALKDGYEFYESENGVILCPGNKNGFLPPEYFLKIEGVV